MKEKLFNILPSGNVFEIKCLKSRRENLFPDSQIVKISLDSFFVKGIFNSSINDFINLFAIFGSIESPSSLNSETIFCIREDPNTVSQVILFFVKTASIFNLDSLFPLCII